VDDAAAGQKGKEAAGATTTTLCADQTGRWVWFSLVGCLLGLGVHQGGRGNAAVWLA
jgi:hypothetical protein